MNKNKIKTRLHHKRYCMHYTEINRFSSSFDVHVSLMTYFYQHKEGDLWEQYCTQQKNIPFCLLAVSVTHVRDSLSYIACQDRSDLFYFHLYQIINK